MLKTQVQHQWHRIFFVPDTYICGNILEFKWESGYLQPNMSVVLFFFRDMWIRDRVRKKENEMLSILFFWSTSSSPPVRPSLSSLLFCLAHQCEHFFTHLTRWLVWSWSQNKTLWTGLWSDVFWTLCACQIPTFWLYTTVHVLFDLHTSTFPTWCDHEVWSYVGLVIGSVWSKVKQFIYWNSIFVRWKHSMWGDLFSTE